MRELDILSKMKILCVEDDSTARDELVEVLRRRSGRVISTEDGARGLEQYNKCKPDIVLVDMLMPNMSGTEMIRRIREENADDIFSVIVLSAVGDSETIINAVDVGIDKYILKPIDMAELLGTLEEQAVQIYNRKYGKPGVEGNPRESEDDIKRAFAALLKQTTGKGPKRASVYINGSRVEFSASEVMTTIERNLYKYNKNIGVIKYTREIFFSSVEGEFCQVLREITGKNYRLEKTIFSVEKDRVKLIFSEGETYKAL